MDRTLTLAPTLADDAHRALGKAHLLAASLSRVETRQVASDYTLRFENKLFQISRDEIRPGLRGATVRVEKRLDGTLAVRFRDRYLPVAECAPRPKTVPPKPVRKHGRKGVRRKSDWMKNFHLGKSAKSSLR